MEGYEIVICTSCEWRAPCYMYRRRKYYKHPTLMYRGFWREKKYRNENIFNGSSNPQSQCMGARFSWKFCSQTVQMNQIPDIYYIRKCILTLFLTGCCSQPLQLQSHLLPEKEGRKGGGGISWKRTKKTRNKSWHNKMVQNSWSSQ